VADPSRPTLVDANVLLDVLTEDPRWSDWSATALAQAADAGPVVINPMIYAEVSVRFSQVEELEAALPQADYVRAHIPWEAAFLAGKCFVSYRRRGGAKRSPLPDFFIGAHAAVAGLRLLTRDASRYRTYFPTVALTAPTRG
jgi:predicted nucleic acid-binding protein